MSKVPAAVSAYLASIGAKGGKASGDAKRRSPEHYKRLAEIRKAKRSKRK